MDGVVQGSWGWLKARVVALSPGWRAGAGDSLRIRVVDPPALESAQDRYRPVPSSSRRAEYQLLPQMASPVYDKQLEPTVESQTGSELEHIEVDWTEDEEKALVRK